jgi:hypothetical protein
MSARDVRMGFAVSRGERAAIRRAAKAASLTTSEYVRRTLQYCAEQDRMVKPADHAEYHGAPPELDADGVPVQATVPGGFAKASQDDL